MANPSAWSDLIALCGLMNLLQVVVGTRFSSEWNLTLERLAQRYTRSMTAIAAEAPFRLSGASPPERGKT